VDADDLYGLPLDSFIPRRGELAKELKAAGDRDAAAEVAALRKPSVAAWAVNQLVRTQPKAIAGLFKAGDTLRKAQDKVLAGRGDADDLRAGVEREREAVATLLEQARGLLNSDGHELSAAVLDRVSDTLHAAALDDGARAEVRDGTLIRELRHAGLGMAGDFQGAPSARKVPPREAPPRTAPPRTAPPRKAPAREPRGPDPRGQATARDEARKAARVAEADARRRVDLAERALRAAEERRDRAQGALDQAKADVKAAQAESKAAAAAHARLAGARVGQ
jgi:hypothetical protein